MPTSTCLIIAGNLLPLVMSAFGGWGVREILPLYWFESAIIGFFTILKILLAGGGIGKPGSRRAQAAARERLAGGDFSALALAGKIFMAAFFTFHFGMFMFGHGVFLFGLILGQFASTGAAGGLGYDWFHPLLAVKWAVLSLVCGHAASFVLNYIMKGEYKTAQAQKCMMAPYARIVIMHLTIMAGGFLAMLTRNAGPALAVFVALKILADARAHIKEHAVPVPVKASAV